MHADHLADLALWRGGLVGVAIGALTRPSCAPTSRNRRVLPRGGVCQTRPHDTGVADMSGSATPRLFRGLFDDASLFPPASLAMADAVSGHIRHQAAWYSETSGPFVCGDAKITELSAALIAAGASELELAVVLPGGVSTLSAAVDAVAADPRLRLRAIEIPIGKVDGAPEATVAAVEALAAALDEVPLAGATAFLEIPARHLTADAITVAADHRYKVKLRTGGVTADAFPDEAILAGCLTTLAAQWQPFKCTAGLHHAVRHRSADTGFEHHGFLNVLLAVAAALDDASVEEVAEVLADQDAAGVAAAVSELDSETADAVRSLFTSFGTCSTDEPIADLVTLGLVSKD